MKLLFFVLYVAIEIAAFVALAYAIGLLWTILATIAAIVIGFWLLRRQIARVLRDLSAATSSDAAGGEANSIRPLADSALLALATVLLVVPGLVTTVLGILLLARPVRAVLRPLVIVLGARKVMRAMDTYARYGGGLAGQGRATVIDGEVVDGERVETDRWDGPDTGQPHQRRAIQ